MEGTVPQQEGLQNDVASTEFNQNQDTQQDHTGRGWYATTAQHSYTRTASSPYPVLDGLSRQQSFGGGARGLQPSSTTYQRFSSVQHRRKATTVLHGRLYGQRGTPSRHVNIQRSRRGEGNAGHSQLQGLHGGMGPSQNVPPIPTAPIESGTGVIPNAMEHRVRRETQVQSTYPRTTGKSNDSKWHPLHRVSSDRSEFWEHDLAETRQRLVFASPFPTQRAWNENHSPDGRWPSPVQPGFQLPIRPNVDSRGIPLVSPAPNPSERRQVQGTMDAQPGSVLGNTVRPTDRDDVHTARNEETPSRPSGEAPPPLAKRRVPDAAGVLQRNTAAAVAVDKFMASFNFDTANEGVHGASAVTTSSVSLGQAHLGPTDPNATTVGDGCPRSLDKQQATGGTLPPHRTTDDIGSSRHEHPRDGGRNRGSPNGNHDSRESVSRPSSTSVVAHTTGDGGSHDGNQHCSGHVTEQLSKRQRTEIPASGDRQHGNAEEHEQAGNEVIDGVTDDTTDDRSPSAQHEDRGNQTGQVLHGRDVDLRRAGQTPSTFGGVGDVTSPNPTSDQPAASATRLEQGFRPVCVPADTTDGALLSTQPRRPSTESGRNELGLGPNRGSTPLCPPTGSTTVQSNSEDLDNAQGSATNGAVVSNQAQLVAGAGANDHTVHTSAISPAELPESRRHTYTTRGTHTIDRDFVSFITSCFTARGLPEPERSAQTILEDYSTGTAGAEKQLGSGWRAFADFGNSVAAIEIRSWTDLMMAASTHETARDKHNLAQTLVTAARTVIGIALDPSPTGHGIRKAKNSAKTKQRVNSKTSKAQTSMDLQPAHKFFYDMLAAANNDVEQLNELQLRLAVAFFLQLVCSGRSQDPTALLCGIEIYPDGCICWGDVPLGGIIKIRLFNTKDTHGEHMNNEAAQLGERDHADEAYGPLSSIITIMRVKPPPNVPDYWEIVQEYKTRTMRVKRKTYKVMVDYRDGNGSLPRNLSRLLCASTESRTYRGQEVQSQTINADINKMLVTAGCANLERASKSKHIRHAAITFVFQFADIHHSMQLRPPIISQLLARSRNSMAVCKSSYIVPPHPLITKRIEDMDAQANLDLVLLMA